MIANTQKRGDEPVSLLCIRVYDYLVANPWRTYREIGDALHIYPKSVSQVLWRWGKMGVLDYQFSRRPRHSPGPPLVKRYAIATPFIPGVTIPKAWRGER